MYHDHHIHPLGYAGLVNGLDLMDAADLGEDGAVEQGIVDD